MGRKLIKVSDSTAIVVEPFKNDYGDYIGVREFYKPRNDLEGDWRPTQKGLSIPVGKSVNVRKAIKWALENFEEEHKVLESKYKKKDDDDEKSSKSKGKDKKKKSRDEDDEDDEE